MRYSAFGWRVRCISINGNVASSSCCSAARRLRQCFHRAARAGSRPSLMADLVRRRVAVIATPGSNPASLAAKAATTTIPIVFGVGEDPVKLGLVASLARPGGNATGINFFGQEVATKRLGLLHDIVPNAIRIAVLVNPANAPTAEATLRDIPEAARALGLQIQVLNASTSRDDRGSVRRPRARPG